ncbi:MAG TPA: tRNA uridine-5-carboxymethylaminomethyl(34) synthesis GTPase MnmE [Pseudolabrys sp.]|nr:tRNA uridine-5-carboxymethylaminomethyl(34) synthesis GTPase MnmE [Pseudolabrys sp.]
MSDRTDTIFALSSGRPPAAIAVVRISGPRAGAALEILMGRIPPPRRAALARLRDPRSREIIDEALALWFPAPNSETGEDVAELQLHGGRAVLAATLTALGDIDGLRPAEAGEFTRRAFEHGKLDLTAVEALADLVGAETEAQRRQAFRQLKGLLGGNAERWRTRLIEALALVEARIDFSDEADVPEELVAPALAIVAELEREIGAALADAGRGERLREGMVVAIAGPPNAGKSTLLNRIARREAAIVSPFAGTTRDVIEVHLDLDGYPVTLLDTAGIRESAEPIEQEGIRRAQERAAEADLVLWVSDAGDRLAAPNAAPGQELWQIRNKVDLLTAAYLRNEPKSIAKTFNISAVRGDGLDSLLVALARQATSFLASGESALITRDRHRRVLTDVRAALLRALAEETHGREDIIAEELRLAANGLGRLTGRVDVEDILDVIFRDFCIGK